MNLPPLLRPQPASEQRARCHTPTFDRVSWAVLVCALVLMTGSIMQKVYRFTLPTDGWSVTGGTIGGPDQDRRDVKAVTRGNGKRALCHKVLLQKKRWVGSFSASALPE